MNFNENLGDGWQLLRMSVHEPLLVLNCESNKEGGVEKMLAFFKNAMVYGGMDPFSGEIHSQTETIMEGNTGRMLKVPHELKKMTSGQIIEMDWLNDNIDGSIPKYRRQL